tara:strand:- start:228 stop:488 length:261 start_codon:yes stop_codon:yes gene_type:complete
LTNADNYGIIRDITKATFNWGNRQHPKTKGNKMNYKKTQMKSDLWDIVYKAQQSGVGREVTNAIIDVMILMDEEGVFPATEEEEKV